MFWDFLITNWHLKNDIESKEDKLERNRLKTEVRLQSFEDRRRKRLVAVVNAFKARLDLV